MEGGEVTDSRAKGKTAEREWGHLLDRWTLEYIREQDGRTQGSDFLVERQYMVEVKRRERLSLDEWSRQVEEDCPPHLVPVVAYRRSHQPWRVSLKAEDFFALLLIAKAAMPSIEGVA